MNIMDNVRLGMMEPWETDDLHGTEAFATEPSPVIGMTIGELEEKYDLCVHHIHEGPVIRATRVMRADVLERKIEPYLAMHVWATADNLNRFLADLH